MHRDPGLVVVETGRNLRAVCRDALVQADHRLGPAGRARSQHQLGDVVRPGEVGAGRGVEKGGQGMVARPGVGGGDHGQAGQRWLLQGSGEGRRVIHEHRRRLDLSRRVGQALGIGAGVAVLRRDGRHGGADAHGGVGDQGVLDAVLRQDQQRLAGTKAQPLQRGRQPRRALQPLGIGQLAPALARALGQPGAGRGGERPMVERGVGGEARTIERRRIGQDDRAVAAPLDLQPPLDISRVAHPGSRAVRHPLNPPPGFRRSGTAGPFLRPRSRRRASPPGHG